MGRISKSLQTQIDEASKRKWLSETTPIKVVVKLKSAPTTSMLSIPRSGKRFGQAMSVLRSAGFAAPAARAAGYRPQRVIEGHAAVTMEVPTKDVSALAGESGVEYVRAVRMHRQHLVDSVQMVGVDSSVHSHYRGRGVTVAVIDSGIDAEHPDLKGRVLKSKSRNFTSEGTVQDTSDRNGHGTHVAGIIGGSGHKYRGVAPEVKFIACKVFDADGAAEEGAIVAAVRWATEQGADVINYSGGYAPIVNHPILGQIVLVDPPWVWPAEPIEEEVEFIRAMDSGVVSVVSAGNEGEIGRRGTLSMPATTPSVISVGSIDKSSRLSGFSSVGPAFRSNKVPPEDAPLTLTPALEGEAQEFPEVDLLAPGGEVDALSASAGGCFYLPGIVSALATGVGKNDPCNVGKRYTRMSGTSQAAPHVAGLAALILEAAGTLEVDLGSHPAFAVKGILKKAASRLSGYNESEQGAGLPTWSAIEAILKQLQGGQLAINHLSNS